MVNAGRIRQISGDCLCKKSHNFNKLEIADYELNLWIHGLLAQSINSRTHDNDKIFFGKMHLDFKFTHEYLEQLIFRSSLQSSNFLFEK